MNAMNQIAEARATALMLRASAKACGPEQRSLKFRLNRAADSLDAIVLIAVRGIERVEVLESVLLLAIAALEGKPCRRQALDDARAALAGTGAMNADALMIDEGSAFTAKDCKLILRALDGPDRLIQAELANKGQDAVAGETRSRILIVLTKLLRLQEGAQ